MAATARRRAPVATAGAGAFASSSAGGGPAARGTAGRGASAGPPALPAFSACHLLEGRRAPRDACDAGDCVLVATHAGEVRAFGLAPFTSLIASFETLNRRVKRIAYSPRGDAVITLEYTEFGSSLHSYHGWRAPWRIHAPGAGGGDDDAASVSSGRSGRGAESRTPRRGGAGRVRLGGSRGARERSEVRSHTVPLAAEADSIAVCPHTGRVVVGFNGTIGVWQCSANAVSGGAFEHVLELEVRPLERLPFLHLALSHQYLMFSTQRECRVVWLDVQYDPSRKRGRGGGGSGHARSEGGGAASVDGASTLDGSVGGGGASVLGGGGGGGAGQTMGAEDGAGAAVSALLRRRQLTHRRPAARRRNFVDYDSGRVASLWDTDDARAEQAHAGGGGGGDGGIESAGERPSTGAVEGGFSAPAGLPPPCKPIDAHAVVEVSFDRTGMPASATSLALVADINIGVQGSGHGQLPEADVQVLGPIRDATLEASANEASGFFCGQNGGTRLLLRRASPSHVPLHSASFAPTSSSPLLGTAADTAGGTCLLISSARCGLMYWCHHQSSLAAAATAAPARAAATYEALNNSSGDTSLAWVVAAAADARERRYRRIADATGQASVTSGDVSPGRPTLVGEYRWASETIHAVATGAYVFALSSSGDVEVWSRWTLHDAADPSSASRYPRPPASPHAAALLAVQAPLGGALHLARAPRALCATASGSLLVLPQDVRKGRTGSGFLRLSLQRAHDDLPSGELESRLAGADNEDEGGGGAGVGEGTGGVDVAVSPSGMPLPSLPLAGSVGDGGSVSTGVDVDTDTGPFGLPAVNIPVAGQRGILLDSVDKPGSKLIRTASASSLSSLSSLSSFARIRAEMHTKGDSGVLPSASPLPKPPPPTVWVLQLSDAVSLGRWAVAAKPRRARGRSKARRQLSELQARVLSIVRARGSQVAGGIALHSALQPTAASANATSLPWLQASSLPDCVAAIEVDALHAAAMRCAETLAVARVARGKLVSGAALLATSEARPIRALELLTGAPAGSTSDGAAAEGAAPLASPTAGGGTGAASASASPPAGTTPLRAVSRAVTAYLRRVLFPRRRVSAPASSLHALGRATSPAPLQCSPAETSAVLAALGSYDIVGATVAIVVSPALSWDVTTVKDAGVVAADALFRLEALVAALEAREAAAQAMVSAAEEERGRARSMQVSGAPAVPVAAKYRQLGAAAAVRPVNVPLLRAVLRTFDGDGACALSDAAERPRHFIDTVVASIPESGPRRARHSTAHAAVHDAGIGAGDDDAGSGSDDDGGYGLGDGSDDDDDGADIDALMAQYRWASAVASAVGVARLARAVLSARAAALGIALSDGTRDTKAPADAGAAGGGSPGGHGSDPWPRVASQLRRVDPEVLVRVCATLPGALAALLPAVSGVGRAASGSGGADDDGDASSVSLNVGGTASAGVLAMVLWRCAPWCLCDVLLRLTLPTSPTTCLPRARDSSAGTGAGFTYTPQRQQHTRSSAVSIVSPGSSPWAQLTQALHFGATESADALADRVRAAITGDPVLADGTALVGLDDYGHEGRGGGGGGGGTIGHGGGGGLDSAASVGGESETRSAFASERDRDDIDSNADPAGDGVRAWWHSGGFGDGDGDGGTDGGEDGGAFVHPDAASVSAEALRLAWARRELLLATAAREATVVRALTLLQTLADPTVAAAPAGGAKRRTFAFPEGGDGDGDGMDRRRVAERFAEAHLMRLAHLRRSRAGRECVRSFSAAVGTLSMAVSAPAPDLAPVLGPHVRLFTEGAITELGNGGVDVERGVVTDGFRRAWDADPARPAEMRTAGGGGGDGDGGRGGATPRSSPTPVDTGTPDDNGPDGGDDDNDETWSLAEVLAARLTLMLARRVGDGWPVSRDTVADGESADAAAGSAADGGSLGDDSGVAHAVCHFGRTAGAWSCVGARWDWLGYLDSESRRGEGNSDRNGLSRTGDGGSARQAESASLRRLQRLLCNAGNRVAYWALSNVASRAMGAAPLVSPTAAATSERYPRVRLSPAARVSLQAVCLVQLSRYRDACEVLVQARDVAASGLPRVAAALAREHKVTFDEWRALLQLLLERLHAAGRGSEDGGRDDDDGDGQDDEATADAYTSCLDFLVDRVHTKSFLGLLPPSGNTEFFLPYISRSLSRGIAAAGQDAVAREAKDLLQFASAAALAAARW